MDQDDQETITRILCQASEGDAEAERQAYDLLHKTLSQIVLSNMSSSDKKSLDATMVVHDLWLRMVSNTKISWKNRQQFFCTAAKIARTIIIDYARKRRASKRGGKQQKASIDEVAEPSYDPKPRVDLIALDEALDRLQENHSEKATVVELKYFAGMKTSEIAKLLDLHPGTVRRRWDEAKTLLHFYMNSNHEMNPKENQ